MSMWPMSSTPFAVFGLLEPFAFFDIFTAALLVKCADQLIPCDPEVRLLPLKPNEPPTCLERGHARSSAAHERVEDDLPRKAEHADDALHEGKRLDRHVVDDLPCVGLGVVEHGSLLATIK